VKIGIIGCGLIGEKRARATAAAGDAVSLVADVQPERAASLAKVAGAKPCADWKEVVSSRDVDAVIVATPHDALAEIALAAVEAGKHVLVEKPGARFGSELGRLAAAAKRRKAIVKVGFNHRFHPALRKAREIVDSGALGPLMFIRARYGHGGRVGYEKEWRAQPQISGGGELIDQGIHLIDLSRWFLGDFPRIDGWAPTYFWKMRVEDNAFLALRTKKGQMAWLHAGWTEWKNIFCFEIFGREGKLQIDGLGGSYGVEKLTHYRMKPEMGPPDVETWEFPQPDESWTLEFQEFVRAVAEKREPSGNLADAQAAFKIIETVYDKSK